MMYSRLAMMQLKISLLRDESRTHFSPAATTTTSLIFVSHHFLSATFNSVHWAWVIDFLSIFFLVFFFSIPFLILLLLAFFVWVCLFPFHLVDKSVYSLQFLFFLPASYPGLSFSHRNKSNHWKNFHRLEWLTAAGEIYFPQTETARDDAEREREWTECVFFQ